MPERGTPALLTALALLWLGCAVLVAAVAPAEAEHTRILYLMMPSGWIAVVAVSALFLGSAAYLGSGIRLWDHLAHAAAELALLFSSIAGVQAVLLARAQGGSWFEVDPRGAGYTLIACVALVYLLSRGVARRGRKAPRVAAAAGCWAFLVAGVGRAWMEGLERSGPVRESAPTERVPAVTVLWLCGLAMTAVFAWLLGSRLVALDRRIERSGRV